MLLTYEPVPSTAMRMRMLAASASTSAKAPLAIPSSISARSRARSRASCSASVASSEGVKRERCRAFSHSRASGSEAPERMWRDEVRQPLERGSVVREEAFALDDRRSGESLVDQVFCGREVVRDQSGTDAQPCGDRPQGDALEALIQSDRGGRGQDLLAPLLRLLPDAGRRRA